MTRRAFGTMILAGTVAACGDRWSADEFRRFESLLLAQDGGRGDNLAAATFRPQIHALPPASRPPTSVFGADLVRGSDIQVESRQILAEALPVPCRSGVVRWPLRPDRMDYTTSATLRLRQPGDGARGNDSPLAVTLGRGGGSGKKSFVIQAAGRWLAGESPQAAILEGVDLVATCSWDLDRSVFGLSVTDALQRTLLDARIPLNAPPEAAIGVLTLTVSGIANHDGPDPRLELVLQPIEFWDLAMP
jgi:hypothetical protein